MQEVPQDSREVGMKKKLQKKIDKKNSRAFTVMYPIGGWVHYGKMKKDGTRKITVIESA